MTLGLEKPTSAEWDARQRGDRVCAIIGCGVRLSRYNPGDVCGVHTPKDYRDQANVVTL
jgi:hypothetical protein